MKTTQITFIIVLITNITMAQTPKIARYDTSHPYLNLLETVYYKKQPASKGTYKVMDVVYDTSSAEVLVGIFNSELAFFDKNPAYILGRFDYSTDSLMAILGTTLSHYRSLAFTQDYIVAYNSASSKVEVWSRTTSEKVEEHHFSTLTELVSDIENNVILLKCGDNPECEMQVFLGNGFQKLSESKNPKQQNLLQRIFQRKKIDK